MRRTLVLFLIIFSLSYTMLAYPASVMYQEEQQEVTQPVQEVIYDTQSPSGIPLDQSVIEDYKNDRDFNYIELEPEENWWTRFKQKLSDIWYSFIRWLFGGESAVGIAAFLLKLFQYLIIIGLVVLLVWLFYKMDGPKGILQQSAANQAILGDDEEIIKNQDIQSLIDQALQDKNYRLAVRYYYLLTLQKLSGQELIDWQVQKTNHDYIYEIENTQLRHSFSRVTDMYDYIWYGNFEVDEFAFAKAQSAFNTVNTQL